MLWPKREEVTAARENCIMTSIMACTAYQILFG